MSEIRYHGNVAASAVADGKRDEEFGRCCECRLQYC